MQVVLDILTRVVFHFPMPALQINDSHIFMTLSNQCALCVIFHKSEC